MGGIHLLAPGWAPRFAVAQAGASVALGSPAGDGEVAWEIIDLGAAAPGVVVGSAVSPDGSRLVAALAAADPRRPYDVVTVEIGSRRTSVVRVAPSSTASPSGSTTAGWRSRPSDPATSASSRSSTSRTARRERSRRACRPDEVGRRRALRHRDRDLRAGDLRAGRPLRCADRAHRRRRQPRLRGARSSWRPAGRRPRGRGWRRHRDRGLLGGRGLERGSPLRDPRRGEAGVRDVVALSRLAPARVRPGRTGSRRRRSRPGPLRAA